MKRALLLLPVFSFLICSCNEKTNDISPSYQPETNDGTTEVVLNLSNFERYISYTKCEGFTGAGGFSPYEAWLEFKGLLSIGIYDVSVTYVVDSKSYNINLDVSGGGKTDYFDRNADYRISSVKGTVTYRL